MTFGITDGDPMGSATSVLSAWVPQMLCSKHNYMHGTRSFPSLQYMLQFHRKMHH